ncbi:MAG: thioredoxin domain-containing protein [Nocardioidaceae bacterium]|nr:thioredoxin domain-containing protein [Nocardioidaceae bacterium]
MASNTAKNDRQQRAEQMRKERERAEKRRRNGITLGIMAVVVVLVAVAAFAIVNEVGKSNDPAAQPANTTDDYGIVYDQAAAGGTPAADAADPVPVVIYEDFQCPACQASEAQNGEFLDQQVASGAITVEYRPIPFLDRASTTEYSSRSANTAACVVDTAGAGAFHELQKLLYTNQPAEGGAGLSDDQLADFARQAGGLETKSCIDDDQFGRWVEEAGEAAQQAEVSATPTVLVGGKPTPEGGGVPSPEILQQAITAAAAA